ncbi:sodium/glutamate symporter family protein [Methanosarcina horonobensis]|uniref:hypothetical protein n=1 Tax=Methanosarcina horonobensis TaxID=418008 RepID=UPI000AB77863|nr:hypothetical protein [Methanosarcina horonobensis]
MTPSAVGMSFLVLGLLLLLGKWIRVTTSYLQKLFIPSSLIGGFLGLVFGPQVLGNLVEWSEHEDTVLSLLAGGIFPEDMLAVWATLPGLFINVIFATLFLGKKLPGVREIWHIAGPQVAFGQTVAWGQYVFGILITVLILTPFFGIDRWQVHLLRSDLKEATGLQQAWLPLLKRSGSMREQTCHSALLP